MADKKDTVILDMRNYYESEVGKFDNAICPDVDTSKELLKETKKFLKNIKIKIFCYTAQVALDVKSQFIFN